jgi:phosphoglycolate phosphatase
MTSEICGNLVSGLGKGALFTDLDWAKSQFIEKLGIDPFPGTLNLRLNDNRIKTEWQSLQETESYTIHASDPDSCDARCYPVFINEQYAGAIVVPLIENYPEDQLEIIAPISLRENLSIEDGDLVKLEMNHPLSATTIIFDLDGTLLDTVDAFYVLAQRTGDEFGIDMNRSHVYDLLNHGKSYWEAALPESTANRQATIDEMNNRAVQLWPEVMAEHARVFPDIFDTLAELKETGMKLGIVTGSGKTSVDLLYSVGVEDLFDAVVTSADVSRRKPYPDGMFKCLDSLGVQASDSIYVGDTSIDMQASRSAGIKAVAVLSGAGNSAALCKAGAHRIIHNHSALVNILN